MVEINKRTFMDVESFKKNEGFDAIQKVAGAVLAAVAQRARERVGGSVMRIAAFRYQDRSYLGLPRGVGMGMKPPRYLKAGDVVRIEVDRHWLIENRSN